MSATILKDKVAVQNVEGVKPLGYLVWFTIPENAACTLEFLKKEFARLGIDPAYLPAPVRNHDVFRRATAAVEQKRIPTQDKKVFVNLLVREVEANAEEVVRQLVMEKVDSKNKRLDYRANAAILVLKKDSGHFNYVCYSDDPTIKGAANKALKLYNQWFSKYSSQRIRHLVKNLLFKMRPTSVRPSGGVYFVPAQYERDLDKLVQLIRTFEGGECWSMPLVNNNESRDMVRAKFHDQVKVMLRELAQCLKAENVKPSEVKDSLVGAKKLLQEIKEYEVLLEESMEDLRNNVQIVQKQVLALADRLAESAAISYQARVID